MYTLIQITACSIPYPTASIPRGTSQKFLSSNFGAENRLGNHLFEVFSIFSIAQKLQRTPIFFIKDGYHEKMLKDVISIVPNLMEQFLVVNGSSWKYFPDRRDEFLGYLKPLRKRLYTLPQSNNFTYVKCVHIRRGDFPAFKIPVADRIFILNALKFIESKEKVSRQMTATVFFGDDFEFMHGLRADVPYSFVSQNEPVDDIFYAKNNCDLVLITAPRSTFGWWLGYFSKGNKTYHMDILYTDDYGIRTGHTTPSDYFLPHWTPLKYAGVDNFTVVESIKSDFY
ncbi:hypothetical protein B9Z55_020846 [Caenorhabditis nigoni]|uniref:L-Fucosyltransferase n=1 Tax=Caenorhabditis nigoni TaxID=1611254 RepID=A0A2G5TPK9_9PELO|nr:hypothetical protein B9Z55_020846 [Caenorhabditis nigoni]